MRFVVASVLHWRFLRHRHLRRRRPRESCLQQRRHRLLPLVQRQVRTRSRWHHSRQLAMVPRRHPRIPVPPMMRSLDGRLVCVAVLSFLFNSEVVSKVLSG